jgi:ribosomal protein L11 methyltransferase
VVLSNLPVLGCRVGDVAERAVEVWVYLDPGQPEAAAEVQRALAACGAESLQLASLRGQDWLQAYRDATRPFPVGDRWWLDPHPETPTPPPDQRIRLAVEPRMAFGSGSHESTQLVLMELEEMTVRGLRVLDVGTGSGILSLACASLGARWVLGLDVDPAAVWVARQVARQQQQAMVPPVYLVGPVGCLAGTAFDMVLCNMITDHFVPLLPRLRELMAEGAVAVLSGILESQDSALRPELKGIGFEVVSRRIQHEWVSLRVVRR